MSGSLEDDTRLDGLARKAQLVGREERNKPDKKEKKKRWGGGSANEIRHGGDLCSPVYDNVGVERNAGRTCLLFQATFLFFTCSAHLFALPSYGRY